MQCTNRPGAKDALGGIFLQNNTLVLPRTREVFRCGVSHTIVFRSRVVNGIGKVVEALAVNDEQALSEVHQPRHGLQCIPVDRHHVIVELGHKRTTVAPIDIVLARDRVLESSWVDRLRSSDSFVVENHCFRLSSEWALGRVSHSNADGLRVQDDVVSTEVEVILPVAFGNCWGPGIAIGPGNVAVSSVENEEGVFASGPGDKITRLPDVELVPDPTRNTIGSHVEIVFSVEYGDVRVGIQTRENRTSHLNRLDLPLSHDLIALGQDVLDLGSKVDRCAGRGGRSHSFRSCKNWSQLGKVSARVNGE